MNDESALLENDIHAYLKQHENKDLLRFLTCGSVDDGKSTLIGRLLHDSKMIFEDQLAAIEKDSKKSGTQGDEVDLALLVDGLQSEREQGITIDVAYRYFSTAKRKFIISDTPGHEQYTRNMVTGASTCDLAIILIDAREGVKTQTRRHTYLCDLLGIKHIIVAVNKMDLVDYQQSIFDDIKSDYEAFCQNLNQEQIYYLPLSALKGDNVVEKGEMLNWYHGPSLIELLETVEFQKDGSKNEFRMPVQYVNRPNSDFRGFSGTIAAGKISVGDKITVLPSLKTSSIKSIVTFDGELNSAVQSQAVTLTLQDEIDISRGDMICKMDHLAQIDDHVIATVVWMSEIALMPNKQYDFKFCSSSSSGSIEEIVYRKDVNTLNEMEATHLKLNEIGLCKLRFTSPIIFDPYLENRQTGAFIIIDRLSNATIAAGMIASTYQDSTSQDSGKFSAFEIELNELIRKHFPHWGTKDLSTILKK